MRIFLFTLLIAMFAGCEEGAPTNAACDSALSYAGFGEQFMADYCTGCHSQDATDREGAPRDVNFDTLEQIIEHADEIDRLAGSGPDATNEEMPPEDPRPTTAEREQLAAWLACDPVQ